MVYDVGHLVPPWQVVVDGLSTQVTWRFVSGDDCAVLVTDSGVAGGAGHCSPPASIGKARRFKHPACFWVRLYALARHCIRRDGFSRGGC